MNSVFKFSLMFLFSLGFFLANINTNTISYIKTNYKYSFDNASAAALSYLSYENDFDIESNSGSQIYVNTDESLNVFYDILADNLSQNHINNLKRYIPLKVFILNDRMVIYNSKDEKKEVPYKITFENNLYQVNLDDENYYPFDKKKELALFINDIIESEINENKLNHIYYNVGVEFENERYNRIENMSFMAFTTGLPNPSLNIFDRNEIFICSFAGSTVVKLEK